FPIPTDLCPAGGLDIYFSKLKDFHPDSLIRNNPFLSHLLEAKNYLTATKTKSLSVSEKNDGLKKWPDLPFIQVKSEKKEAKPRSTITVDNILNMVALPGESPGSSPKLQNESAQIDSIFQQVFSHIFSNERFRYSETAWLGLKLLLRQCVGNSDVRIEIVPTALDTLGETLNNLIDTLINDLPSLIIVDFPFENSPFCIELLEKIAQFAETLLVPAMVWINPKFMQINSWDNLNELPFIPHYLEEQVFAKWRRLKNQSSANWLAVTCNRFLIRYPYGSDNTPRKFQFREYLRPWTGPVWAASCLIAQSFNKIGWPTRFTDWQGIKIEDLALNTESSTRPIPTEVSFTEDRIDQFRRAGIMPLATILNKDIAFTPLETTVGGASLSYQLFVSRITQLILWCQDNFPKDLSGTELEDRLRQAFSMFWVKSGHAGPENLKISAGHPGPDNRIPLRIDLQPSRKILPSGEKIVLEFSW
ncbi:MAG: type VI secretion system contractile sheath large subunit, partial [Anaerolineales bacterium]|nr:type VI secretion system contractile sheath large subunit [Anaerolineales bacterium]